MSTSTPPTSSGLSPSQTRWASSLTVFAAAMMVISGIWNAFVGIAALVHNKVYVSTPSYTYSLDLTGWGWIFLVLGILAAATGAAVLAGQTWGRYVGIGLISLSLVMNFLFIPYYPLWSITIIVIDIAAIWALAVYRRDPS
jgi:hypothetical protein